MNPKSEALALFASHGVLDTATTLYVASQIGESNEPNPIVRTLLEASPTLAATVMLLVVGTVAILWPTIDSIANPPRWFMPGLILVGLLVSGGNLLLVI